MELQSGQRLSHYSLVEQIGAGGMGVVWKATDTTLQRDVAVKVLPDNFADEPQRLARFEREAKLLATLNHSGIATIHGMHHDAGVHFLAMELVPGEDLAQRLKRGRMAVDEALRVALQIAEALDAAHENGIIHRDLKPANVKMTPDGQIKLLDFGLAKAYADESPEQHPDLSLSPTQTSAGTVAGLILGTAAYMSPEQARGRPLDRRADIWTFGCVLFELLTGKQAFLGETVSDTLAAILTREPDWEALPADLPPRARRILERCLRKEPQRRLRDAGDAAVLLQETLEGSQEDMQPIAVPTRGSRLSRWLPWGLAVVAILFAAVMRDRAATPAPDAASRHVAIRMPTGTELGIATDRQILAISPDGSKVVFVGNTDGEHKLHLRFLDGRETRVLPGTERGRSPFFSPDGEWIGFFSEGMLKKLAVRGGNPITLAEAGFNRGGTWGTNGVIVFAPYTNSGLMQVPAAGGEPQPLTQPNEAENQRSHRWPYFLPDGDTVLFTIGDVDKPGDYEAARIGAVSLATGETHEIYRGASMARYSMSGHLILGREGVLGALPFDASTLTVLGEERIMLQDVGGEPSSGVVFFDLAHDGTLVYTERDERSKEHKLGWMDQEGRWDELPAPAREYLSPKLSPDGRTIALHIGPGEGRDTNVWLYDIERNTSSRLTFNRSSEAPVWSADGKHLAFLQLKESGDGAIVRKPADGSAAERDLLIVDSASPFHTSAWTPDGREIVYVHVHVTTEGDVHALDVETGDVRDVVATPALEWSPALSPDGRWIAYSSAETGSPEVYVASFSDGSGRWQVSQGGFAPCWSRDGSKLFYLDDTNMMMVEVQTDPTFRAGTPTKLFEGEFLPSNSLARNYDVAKDGRFLMIRRDSDEVATDHINLVTHWFGELEELAPQP